MEREESPSQPPQSNPSSTSPSPKIHTYHCSACFQLLLATAVPLEALQRRRSPPGLDGALILPLPPPPPPAQGDVAGRDEQGRGDNSAAERTRGGSGDDDGGNDGAEEEEEEEEGSAEDADVDADANGEGEGEGGIPPTSTSTPTLPTAVLVNTTQDRRPVIIRREDGFEKRVVGRCGRCKVGFGYWILQPPQPRQSGQEEDARGEGEGKGEIVYLLPGGSVETEEMMMMTKDKEVR